MKTNHPRDFKARAYSHRRLRAQNGGVRASELSGSFRTFPDKSMMGWSARSSLADKAVTASITNDFTNGNRGMAKAVRGAKKFVRSRTRFHENAATRKLAADLEGHVALDADVEGSDDTNNKR